MKRNIPLGDFFLLKVNPVIRFLILADIATFSALGLLGPIFAIFVTEFIEGGTVEVAGVAAAIYLLTKSLTQIPAAALIDKICGDKDDYWFLVGGMLVVNLVPLSYLLVSNPAELYFTQFLLGAATAFTFPSFMALFTHYVDGEKAGTTWGVYYTLIDIAQAATAAIGGVLAASIGFEKVIYLVTSIGLLSMLFYVPIAPSLRKKPC
ncbi:MAG: MFS transporter [Patescibacteria group bacterium]